MMNLTPLPPISHSALAEALTLLGSPRDLAKKTDDLVAVHAKASAATDEALKIRSDVVDKQTTLAAERAAFEVHQATAAEFLRESSAKLDTRASELDALEKRRQEAMAAREAALAAAVETHRSEVAAFHSILTKLAGEVRVRLPA